MEKMNDDDWNFLWWTMGYAAGKMMKDTLPYERRTQLAQRIVSLKDKLVMLREDMEGKKSSTNVIARKIIR